MNKRYLLLSFLCFLFIYSSKGGNQGTPLMRNYLPKDYKAHAQNFAVVQDKRGFMLFANTNGVLVFDGASWRTIRTKDFSIPRSMAVAPDGKVYIGTRGDMGMLISDSKGTLLYKSVKTLAKSLPDFSDIHSIVPTEKGVYFFSDKVVFYLHGNTLTYQKSEFELGKSFAVGKTVYTQSADSGLMMVDESLKPRRILQTTFFRLKTETTGMLPHEGNTILVATKNDGLFLMNPNDPEPKEFAQSLKDFFRVNRISSVTRLSDGSYAVGTVRNGITIVSHRGELITTINRSHSLNDELINDIASDNQDGIWVALNEGIARVDFPSPFSRYGVANGLMGNVNDITFWNGTYYVATQEGVFKKQQNYFVRIKDSTATLSLQPTENGLLAATTEGVFLISANDNVRAIVSGYTLSLKRSALRKDIVFCGLLDGLLVLRYANGQWNVHAQAQSVNDECRSIIEDVSGNVWVATSMRGILRYHINDVYSGKMSSTRYGTNDGLRSAIGNHISLVNGVARFTSTSEPGVKRFDNAQNKFIIDHELNPKDASGKDSLLWLGAIIQASDNSFWAADGDGKNVTRYSLSNNGLRPVQAVFSPISEYQISAIFAENTSSACFGVQDGLLFYNGALTQHHSIPFNSYIRHASYGSDSLLYDGAYYSPIGLPSPLLQSSFPIPNLRYDRNTLTFEFCAPAYNFEDRTLYRYKLEGFDNVWSPWSTITKKEYTNLPDGTFTFKVQAKNVYGIISKQAEFPFVIEKPWFRTWWSYVLYIFISGSTVIGIFRWRLQKSQKEKEQLENVITERTKEIQAQKEEIEKKSGELEGKNDELAKINAIVKSINSEIDLNRLLTSILERILVFKGVRRGIAYVRVGDSEDFAIRSHIGWNEDDLMNTTIPYGILQERYLELCEELYEDIFYSGLQDDIDYIGRERIGNSANAIAVMIVPVNGIVEGVVVFEGGVKTEGFESRLLGLLHNLKEHVIAAFIKSKILSDLQQKNDIIEEYAELTRKQLSSIQRDLEIAAKIQHAILPDWKETFQEQSIQFSLAAEMVAAKDVGGDFYDFFRIDEDRVGFVIADVSGKGMPAALFMAVSRTMLKSQALLGGTPGNVLEVVNDLLCRENVSTLFVTVFYCILNEKTGEVLFSNGGHNLPYIIRSNGNVEVLPKTTGMGLAIMEEMNFQTSQFTLNNGDTLYLYTDGVTEAMDIDDQLYSDQRLAQFLATLDRSKTIEEQMKMVFSDIKKYVRGAAQSDDITMLMVRYDGNVKSTGATQERANPMKIDSTSNPIINLTLLNKKPEISKINGHVEEFLDENEVPMKTAFQTDLTLDELLTNVITHGFPNGGDHQINVSVEVDKPQQAITIVIEDDGIEFDPTTIAEADTTSDLEERAIGGLGIHFVRKISSSMLYSRNNNRNHLTIALPFRDE